MSDLDRARARFGLRHGDRCLVLGQRLAGWITHAPDLEEELAFANVGLDLLGQARLLLARAGTLEGEGRDEDALAYRRGPDEFLNVLLVEQPNGDFANTMVRQLLHDAYAIEMWAALRASGDDHLAAVAAKAVKESAYHLRHATTWVVRLGDGTEESQRRTRDALSRLWPYTTELFEVDETERLLLEEGILPVDAVGEPLRARWSERVAAVLHQATLRIPDGSTPMTGGRHGRHGPELVALLEELQSVHRSIPGATW